MDKKYLKYSIEDFTQDIKFINWVHKGDGHKDWEDFINQNPIMSKDIKLARKIVSALRFSPEDIDEVDTYEIYKNIDLFYNICHKSKRTVRIRRFLRYAALFVMIFSIGAAIPYLYFTHSKVHFSEITDSSLRIGDAKLITASGHELLLTNSQSDLRFNKSGDQLEIDQDSIISLDSEINQMAELVVPYGKRSKIQLSDGTNVWLNAGSSLVFPQKFKGKERKVFLKGEAYFEVSKNKDIPFVVGADQMNINVHGTKFNVNNYESENNLEVVLVEGVVGLKETNFLNLFSKEIVMSPNQKAVYNKTDKLTNIESNIDVNYYTSWTNGLLEFNKESIITVFDKLSRFYNVQFITDDQVEIYKKISGKLDLKESLEVVMIVISDAAPITFRINEEKVFVNSKTNLLPMR